MASSLEEFLRMIGVKEADKPSLISRVYEKVQVYYSDELRSIWQTYDRDWTVYSKKNLEALF